jgi:hypothetical protein
MSMCMFRTVIFSGLSDSDAWYEEYSVGCRYCFIYCNHYMIKKGPLCCVLIT